MASKCPKCHEFVADDVVCCADLRYTWKCKSCGKLTTGFVVPYGRCYLCGGDHEVVKGYDAKDPEVTRVVEEAVRYELEMYTFYRLAKERTSSKQLEVVLEDLYLKEQDHLEELEDKYHVHVEDEWKVLPADAEKGLSSWLFEGIDFSDEKTHVTAIYDKAIEMEKRTRDHFKARAEEVPEGTAKQLFRELAAEEEDHVTMLETEREQFE